MWQLSLKIEIVVESWNHDYLGNKVLGPTCSDPLGLVNRRGSLTLSGTCSMSTGSTQWYYGLFIILLINIITPWSDI